MQHTHRNQDQTLLPATLYHKPRCSKSRLALERPIAVTPERAAPGRPPDNVFDVL